jgi:hypothetical protein
MLTHDDQTQRTNTSNKTKKCVLLLLCLSPVLVAPVFAGVACRACFRFACVVFPGVSVIVAPRVLLLSLLT